MLSSPDIIKFTAETGCIRAIRNPAHRLNVIIKIKDGAKNSPILKKFLKVLGDNSFGIYLSHMLIIRILNKLVPMANIFPINAIFVIMISTVCVMMAHRILGKHAYVIGV